jgi:hypothetical protein
MGKWFLAVIMTLLPIAVIFLLMAGFWAQNVGDQAPGKP